MEDSPTINKHCGHGQYIDIPLSIIDSAISLEDQIVDREIAIQEREMDVKEHNKKEKRKRKRGRVKKNKMELSQSYGCEKSVDISEIKTVCHPDREKHMVSDTNDMTTEGVNEIVAKFNQKEPNIIKINKNIDNYCSQNMLDCSLLTDQGLVKNMPDNVSVSTEKLNTINSKKLLRKTGKVGVDLDRRKNSMLKPKFTQRSWLDDDADGDDTSEADILTRNDQALDTSSYCFIKPSKSSINACNIAVDECTSSVKLVADDVQNSTKLCESIDENDVKISDCFDVRINQKCQKVTDDFICYETVNQNEEKRETINEADESSLKDHHNKEKSDFDQIAVKKLPDKIFNYKMKMNEVNHDASLDSDNENLRAIESPVSKSLPTVLQDHTSIQLNAYKNRFTGCTNMQNYEQSNMNNLTCVKKDVDVRIGTNVNDLKNDRIDKIKRSRRKTEPFDFELQSDGVLMKNNKPKYENASNINIQDDKMISVDNQTKKTSYINSNQNEIPTFDSNQNEKSRNSFSGTDKTRNLFSGFISDSGVFVPTSNMDKRSSRDSLDRIFDEECSEEDSLDDYDVDFEDGDGSESENGSSDCRSESEDEALPPEPQLGNVEYKLKLVTPTKQRFEHLVTQMKWRLREGRGEALYEIGVRDCGRVRGLSSRDLRASLRTLRRMAARLGAACALLTRGRVPGNPKRERAEVLVRKIPDDQHNIEVRVAVMGSNDAGKSTLVGVLTQGELDNGRGRARLNMFRHLHEVRTGRTSSVSHEILGFDPQGHPINYAYSELMTSEEIAERSSKLVSFIDLAGHRKYLKTTVQGLTGYSPHYAMLVVSATAGINQMTLEHLALVTALDLPFFIAVTKIDSTSPEKVIEALRQALNTIGCRKVPLPVLTQDDVILAASNALSRVAVPVFPVSSVSGCGLDRLGWFLFLAPPAMATCERDRLEQEPVEFQIDETFKVGGTSGPVVGGLLTKGVLTERTRLLIGPLDSGDFVPITVISLHRNKAPCRVVRAGQAASLGLSVRPPTLRQGMVILAIPDSYPGQIPNPNLTKTSAIIQSKTRIENEKPQNFNNKAVKLSNQVSPRSQKNKMISESKESNLKIRQEDIVEIVDGIGTKGVTNDVNVIKHVDDNDKLERLSPSRYTNRFVSSFGNVCTIPSASIDIDIDSIEGFDEESNGNETESLKDEDKTCVESEKVIAFPAKDIDEGILKEDPNNPRGCYCFQATVSVLYHSTAIYPGFQATVHIGNIRQTAVIEGILAANSLLRAKDRAPVVFRFVRHPEYVKTGAHLLFREGLHTKGIGVVTQVFPHGSSDAIQHDK